MSAHHKDASFNTRLDGKNRENCFIPVTHKMSPFPNAFANFPEVFVKGDHYRELYNRTKKD